MMSPSLMRRSVVSRSPVEEGAVGGSEIVDHEPAARAMDLGVVTARVPVGDDDPAIGQPADQVAPVCELDPIARRHHDGTGTAAGLTLLDLRRDAEAAWLSELSTRRSTATGPMKW